MAKKYDESDGIWRTVGGRRIFIKNDQTLADAMKESGKFKDKKQTKVHGYERNIDIKELYKNEDYSEVISYLNQKELRTLEEATKDLDYYEKGTPAYKNAEQAVNKLEAEAANRFAERNNIDKYNKDTVNKFPEKSVEHQIYERGQKRSFTREELKEKYGTDDVELINAGKTKEDRVSMINNENVASELRKADNWSDINKTIDNIKDEKVKEMMKKEAQKLEENENGAWKSSEYLAKQYNFYNEDSKKSNGKLVSTKLNEDEVTSYSQWKKDYGTNIAELEKDLKLSERYLDEDSEGYREAKKSLENGRKYLEDLKKADKTVKRSSEPKTFFEGKKDIEEEAKQIYAEDGIWATSDSNVAYFAKKYGIPKTQAKQFLEDTGKRFDEENRAKNNKIKNEAFKKYKKEHPNSKMSLEEFLKK